MWEKETIIDVQCWQENPNPRVHKALFPTWMVVPRVRIFLSPLNTNDGFY